TTSPRPVARRSFTQWTRQWSATRSASASTCLPWPRHAPARRRWARTEAGSGARQVALVNGLHRRRQGATIGFPNLFPRKPQSMTEISPALARKIAQTIAEEIGAQTAQVVAAVGLLDEGATVPFIARYRKEVTGGLDDTQLRNLEVRLGYL